MHIKYNKKGNVDFSNWYVYLYSMYVGIKWSHGIYNGKTETKPSRSRAEANLNISIPNIRYPI